MFSSLESGCLKKEQRHYNKDKGLSGEVYWQVSDEHEDGSKAHH
jgi:hypothetical protein